MAFENLGPEAFASNMNADENSVLLDVRTPAEVAESRIPNSINIDFRSPDFISEVDDLDKEKSYYVYCRSGARSANACMQMSAMGFGKLVNLEGGILGWTGETES